MSSAEQIEAFLAGDRYAVVGASHDRHKYGNKVLRCYWQNEIEAIPVNPNAGEVEGVATIPDLQALTEPVHGISIITPPEVTEQIVEDAIAVGIEHLWMQPGAESERAIQRCNAAGLNVIAGGPCLLVVLGYREGQ